MYETQLIAVWVKGDRRAQKALYDTYSRRMMGVCVRYVNDSETARDVLQDGFVKVFSHLSSYTGEGVFEGWMRRIFVNEALGYLRQKDVLREAEGLELLDTHGMSHDMTVDDLSVQELMEVIRSLPTGYRTVFNLCAVEGYSHKEIAEQLSITESTSRSQYMRERQMLQEKLKR